MNLGPLHDEYIEWLDEIGIGWLQCIDDSPEKMIMVEQCANLDCCFLEPSLELCNERSTKANRSSIHFLELLINWSECQLDTYYPDATFVVNPSSFLTWSSKVHAGVFGANTVEISRPKFEFYQPSPLEVLIEYASKFREEDVNSDLNLIFMEWPDSENFAEVAIHDSAFASCKDSSRTDKEEVASLVKEQLLLEYCEFDFEPSIKLATLSMSQSKFFTDLETFELQHSFLFGDSSLLDLSILKLETILLKSELGSGYVGQWEIQSTPVVSFDFLNGTPGFETVEETPVQRVPDQIEIMFSGIDPSIPMIPMRIEEVSSRQEFKDSDDCSRFLVLNYGILAEYKLVNELRRAGFLLIERDFLLIERDFGPPGSKLIQISEDSVVLVMSLKDLTEREFQWDQLYCRFENIHVVVTLDHNEQIGKGSIQKLACLSFVLSATSSLAYIATESEVTSHIRHLCKTSKGSSGSLEESLSAVKILLVKLSDLLSVV